MQDEDRALLDGRRRNARSSASRSTMESSSSGPAGPSTGRTRTFADHDAATPGLGVAGMDEQAPDPGLEAVRVAKRRELAPGGDEGALQGILGEIGCRAGSGRDREHPVAGQRRPATRTPRDRRASPARRRLAPSLPRFSASGRRYGINESERQRNVHRPPRSATCSCVMSRRQAAFYPSRRQTGWAAATCVAQERTCAARDAAASVDWLVAGRDEGLRDDVHPELARMGGVMRPDSRARSCSRCRRRR